MSTLYIGMNLLTTAVLCTAFGLIFGFGWGYETAQAKEFTPEIAPPQPVPQVASHMPLPLLLEIEQAEQERIAA